MAGMAERLDRDHGPYSAPVTLGQQDGSGARFSPDIWRTSGRPPQPAATRSPFGAPAALARWHRSARTVLHHKRLGIGLEIVIPGWMLAEPPSEPTMAYLPSCSTRINANFLILPLLRPRVVKMTTGRRVPARRWLGVRPWLRSARPARVPTYARARLVPPVSDTAIIDSPSRRPPPTDREAR